MCCSVLAPEIVQHDAYICGRLWWTKITHKASDMAIELFRSFTRDLHARRRIYRRTFVQRITLNASCMTISGERTEQLDIFCRVTGFTSDFLSVSCGTYSVLSRSPSVINSSSLPRFSDKWFGRRNH